MTILVPLLLLAAGCGGTAPDARDAAEPPSAAAPVAVTSPAAPAGPVPAEAAAAAEPADGEAADGGIPADSVFTPVLPRLREAVRIPLRLPRDLGWGDEAPDSAFAIVERADVGGYELIIGLASDCDGGNWCRYGRVSGERAAGAEPRPDGTPVPLAEGVTGHFVDATCGAVCGDSVLWWEEGGVRYAVGVKAGSAETLAAVARSALAP